MYTIKLQKFLFLSVQVLETLETNVPQMIVIEFETLLSLREIFVSLIIHIQ